MKFIFFFLIMYSPIAQSSPSLVECLQQIDRSSLKLTWTAFKTQKKIGVTGTFSKIDYIIAKNKTEIIIDSSSVDTGDKGRDENIKKFFFLNLGKPIEIKGKVQSFDADSLKMTLTLNSISKEVIFSNKSSADKFRILTSINVLDFMMGSNLKALTLACKAQHQNITWPDVTVVVEGNLKQKCF